MFRRTYRVCLQGRRVHGVTKPKIALIKNPQVEITFIIIIIIYLFILTANGFLPGGSGTTIRHNTQITHHTQTKHSTQNYTINKGHTTHNEYNANTVTTTII
jgi:hypothetical protein